MDFQCLCSALVCEWQSVTVCLWVKKSDGLSRQSPYFMLEQTPKKRAVHNALFERELLQWNTLIKMTIHDTNNIDFPNISSMKMLLWIVLILFPELCIESNKSRSWLLTGCTHSLLDRWEKISLDKKSLQIQAKSCDFIFNLDVIYIRITEN